MSVLLCISIIFTAYIYFILNERALTIKNIVKLFVSCLFILFGKTLYCVMDNFLKNNMWAFLLVLFFAIICAVSKQGGAQIVH